MTAYTDFHYSPTGSGVISGAQVLEQTEQGINGLGQYVQDNVSGAIDTANQALTIAQTADSNATLALNTANSFASAISAANNTANNALTTAQSAQNTANTASSLATTANNNANTALNAANTATSNVATLTGTVNSLGNRMTAAENAISTNAGNITTLQTNLQTTNNNVTAAANAASSAQATATSAQATATSAKNTAYVLRYTGTTITGGGTIAYADIDNTDNIKAGDKIIDISGAIYSIASVDTANQTVTVGASPVINLFCDAENLIPAANEAYDLGSSSYQWNNLYAKNYYYNGTAWGLDQANVWSAWQTQEHATEPLIRLRRSNLQIGDPIPASQQTIGTIPFADKDNINLGLIAVRDDTNGNTFLTLAARQRYDSNGRANNGTQYESRIDVGVDSSKNLYLRPNSNNKIDLGTSANKWKTLNGINPGALSLPSTATTDASGDIVPPSGESSINLSGGANTYTPSNNGWLTLAINCASGNCIIVRQNTSIRDTLNYMQGYVPGQANIYLTLPVLAGVTYYVFLYATSFVMARFALCQGNV